MRFTEAPSMIITEYKNSIEKVEFKAINDIVRNLSEEKFGDTNIHNQYVNKLIASNLEFFLSVLLKQKPTVFLVGEASGYNGCYLSGIPFTSEDVIKNNKFFKSKIGEIVTSTIKPQKESSSTIVWQTLENLNIMPLMWNAFPFHPFKAGVELSNRSPNKNELELGKKYLELLLREFTSINVMGAIGNHAYNSLEEMNLPIKIIKIRHPANGGKLEFVKGVKKCHEM